MLGFVRVEITPDTLLHSASGLLLKFKRGSQMNISK